MGLIVVYAKYYETNDGVVMVNSGILVLEEWHDGKMI